MPFWAWGLLVRLSCRPVSQIVIAMVTITVLPASCFIPRNARNCFNIRNQSRAEASIDIIDAYVVFSYSEQRFFFILMGTFSISHTWLFFRNDLYYWNGSFCTLFGMTYISIWLFFEFLRVEILWESFSISAIFLFGFILVVNKVNKGSCNLVAFISIN